MLLAFVVVNVIMFLSHLGLGINLQSGKSTNRQFKVIIVISTYIDICCYYKDYSISKEELESNIQLSSGDGDVRALEIAVNKYFEEERGVEGRLDIDGNWMFVAYNILTGKGDFDHFFPHGSNVDKLVNPDYYDHKFTDDEIDQFNDKNRDFTVSAKGNKENITLDIGHREQLLITKHAYAVIRSDSEYVYLVNPWDSGSELKVTREQFKDFFNYV